VPAALLAVGWDRCRHGGSSSFKNLRFWPVAHEAILSIPGPCFVILTTL
jgi:hypothetical protein